ncbi:hypothetical protein PIB30_009799 [Stylosanthes scabra]|uniref:Uncharacterized protein n=1 Tax=Stylosanthes scabra TaxID=79078 RepID=A0ABU6Y5I3_9FABA|nr:hypothetical protein [Stylosanthes scabra]
MGAMRLAQDIKLHITSIMIQLISTRPCCNIVRPGLCFESCLCLRKSKYLFGGAYMKNYQCCGIFTIESQQSIPPAKDVAKTLNLLLIAYFIVLKLKKFGQIVPCQSFPWFPWFPPSLSFWQVWRLKMEVFQSQHLGSRKLELFAILAWNTKGAQDPVRPEDPAMARLNRGCFGPASLWPG